ncbi:hypothetical protein MMC11_002110 [Xylographa trunciseda]|nr:hypothetical protein [Xylographa trunciseda]
MKASTIIYALVLAGTCASLPIATNEARTPLSTVSKSENHTSQRVPAAFPTNSAGEMVFPHGMNGHTIHPMPTTAATHPDHASTVVEGRDNSDAAPGDVRKILEAIYPDVEGRAVPFPPLHGVKNGSVDTPDHGYLPPYTHHHPRDNGTLGAANHRHLPPWKFHHSPHHNRSTEVVSHRRLPPWMHHQPTATLAIMTSSTSNTAIEAATTTSMLALG